MIVSEHAREEMQRSCIDESEVEACLEHGELVIKQFAKGEMRYGKQIDLKDKRIVVIYVHSRGDVRVITTYTIKRKKWQEN